MSTPFQSPGAGEIELKRAKRLEDVRRNAPRYLNTFRRAYAGKSLRAAVNAFCVECNGFDAAAIRDCTAPACPLFLYRPGCLKDNSSELWNSAKNRVWLRSNDYESFMKE